MELRKAGVAKMTNEGLLEAYAGYCYHAGDDFSLHPVTDAEHREADLFKAELLKRLNRK